NDGTNSYSWDARNRLASVASGNTASFQYDPVGRRIAKTISGTVTNLLFNGSNVIQELSGGSVTANLLTGGTDEYLARTTSAGALSFLSDPLGSTLALTNSAGTIQTPYTYDPFGGGLNFTPSNPYQYTGRENDGTGLYYYRARYYSPTFQRFLSEDPARLASGTTNLYAYAENNPVQLTDPSGMTTMRCRLDCAKELANRSGLSGLYDKNSLPGPFGLLAGGVTDNTVSGIVELGDAWVDKDVAGVATAYATGGVYQGVPVPLGDGVVESGVSGALTNNAIRGVEEAGTDLVLGAAATGTEAVAADAVPIVGWLKFGYDVVSFGTSLVLCW
ncbi:MAG TPA: RHS repeat-associated core domain-containing protein, partial [Candidatus Acidoferrum sp.]|nr:RHS repeat-associated core domain-containing protein [Candidatus Acidoferrum sp.]